MNAYQRSFLTDEQLRNEIQATKDTLEGLDKYDWTNQKILESILKYLLKEQKTRFENRQLKLAL
jgi:hypothetical protein